MLQAASCSKPVYRVYKVADGDGDDEPESVAAAVVVLDGVLEEDGDGDPDGVFVADSLGDPDSELVPVIVALTDDVCDAEVVGEDDIDDEDEGEEEDEGEDDGVTDAVVLEVGVDVAECDGGGNRGPKTLTVHIASCSGEGAPFARSAKLAMHRKARSPVAPRRHKLTVRILCCGGRTVCRVHAHS